MEHIGFEPMTSSMPWMRATNCANAPNYEVIRLELVERHFFFCASCHQGHEEPSYYTILTCKNQLQNLEYHIYGR